MDEPGQVVTVSISGQKLKTEVNDKGYWKVTLAPMKASYDPKIMKIKGSSTLTYANILIGEVWLCSRQSNMGWECGKLR